MLQIKFCQAVQSSNVNQQPARKGCLLRFQSCLRWECAKLGTISSMILTQQQKKFAAKTVANEKQCLKEMLKPSLTRKTSIFDSKFFLGNLLLKKVIHCVTDQLSITWSGKSVLNFKSSILTSEVDVLIDRVEKKLRVEEMSYPIYVQCYNLYQ